jgi:hypothetical protein
MKRSILFPIIGGAILGSIVFFTGPFLFFFVFAVLTLKFIFTPFGMGRIMMMQRFGAPGKPSMAFADKIRNMNEDEYAAFQARMNERRHNGCCH